MTTTASLGSAIDVIADLNRRQQDMATAIEWVTEHVEDLDGLYLHPGTGGAGARIMIQVGHRTEDPPVEMARLARLLAQGAPFGSVTKEFTDELAYVRRRFGTAAVEVYASRDLVCERVVVGTEEVEEYDPTALATVPKVVVEREVVEWRCAPLLDTEAVAT